MTVTVIEMNVSCMTCSGQLLFDERLTGIRSAAV
jgi:hypothetical protein